MTDFKPRKNINIDPLDLAATYVDSTFNEGSVSSHKLVDSQDSEIGLFHPGTLGARTTPGEGGFNYADAPQATVFIAKKEWVDQEWTYVSGSLDERKGKVQETLTRMILGNLITRKLDLLNDHELFTKFSQLNAASSSFEQSALNKLSVDNLNANVMADILTLAGSPVTKYYTETLKITTPADSETKTTDKTKDFTVLIALSATVTTTAQDVSGRLRIHRGPNMNEPVLAGIKNGQTFQTTGAQADGDRIFNVASLPEELLKDPEIDPEDLKKVIGKFPVPTSPGNPNIGLWFEVDLTKLTADQVYLNKEALTGDDKTIEFSTLQSYKKGYVLRVKSETNITLFNTKISNTEPYPEKITLKAGTKNIDLSPPTNLKDLGTIRNAFNGVIELANITNISTNSDNKGGIGKASITLQNPNNLLYISEDDIEIAMGTRQVDQEYLDTNPKNGTLVTRKDLITGKNVELKYYNGKFYTQTAFNLVTRPDLSAVANETSSLEVNKFRIQLDEIKGHIENLQIYKADGTAFTTSINSTGSRILDSLNKIYPADSVSVIKYQLPSVSIIIQPISKEGIQDPGYQYNQVNVQQKINQLNERYSSLSYAIERSKKSSITSFSKENTQSVSLKYIKNQLIKYFQNRTIFEVYDRVYIWTTSPSRSSFRLEDGTIVGESPNISSTQQIFLQRIRDIISLLKQINNTVLKNGLIQGKNLADPFSLEALQQINNELFQSGRSSAYDDIVESDKVPSDPITSALLAAVDLKMEDLSKFFELTTNIKSSQQSLAIQGLDPAKLLEADSLAGIEENQFQIFQGTISSIVRGYSEGVFTIRIECSNNLEFLQRTRYTSIPGLNVPGRLLRTEMDDPIWRKTRNQKTIELFKKLKIEDAAGRWKSGVFTACADLLSDNEGDLQTQAKSQNVSTGSSGITEHERKNLADPLTYAFDQPFQGADPATIVSILVTGTPFNIANYLLNNVGTMNVPSKGSDNTENSDELVPTGHFENLRAQIQGQNKKLGDFEPYIEKSSPTLSKEAREDINSSTILTLGGHIVNFVLTYISTRPDVFPQIRQIVHTQRSQQDGSGIYKGITIDNINKLFDYNSQIFPTKPSDIVLLPNSLNDARLEYLVQAAINQSRDNDLNQLLSDLTIKTDDKQIAKFKSFVPSASSSTISQFYDAKNKYIMNSNDLTEFNNILSSTATRVKQGRALSLLYDKNGQKELPNDYKIPSTSTLDIPLKKKIAALRGVKLSDDGKDIISGTPVQSTKAAIVFKHKSNFLIISDEYYKSPNLIDHTEKIIENMDKHFFDDYLDVLTRCTDAARIIDWEFYADSQGHIRFKQPTYNRTLLKHLLDFQKVDITIRTAFVALFKDNIKYLIQNSVYKATENIALSAKISALTKLKNIFSELSILPIRQDLLSLSSFLGLSTPTNVLEYMVDTKKITPERIQEIAGMLTLPPTTPTAIEPQTNLPDKIKIEAKLAQDKSDIADLVDLIATDTSLLTQKNLLEGTSLDDYLKNIFSQDIYEEYETSKIIYESLYNNLDRQDVHIFSSSENTLTSADLKDQLDDLSTNAKVVIEGTISFIVYCSSLIAEIEHLKTSIQGELSSTLEAITDQKFIHVIPSSIIISEDYSETPPDFTRLNVYSTIALKGKYADTIASEAVQWAGSVDYDLWRTYGYKKGADIEAPFLRTNTQAVIYAHQLMARQYSKILTGSITVRGDSKYQLGDTVFIEDENLYYYITGVSHSFTYNSTYSTTLTLEYGRRPGHYIPYPFDVLGSRMIDGVLSIWQVEPTDVSAMLDAQAKYAEANQKNQP